VVVPTEWVGFGRPAADALRREIARAKAGAPLAPVTVVVPTNQVGVATRRLLASGALGPVCEGARGIAAVTFLTVYRMGELLGAARLAGAGRRPVSTPVIGAALRAALADDPGIFAPVASHPATESALVGAYRELRDLSPEALRALSAESPRARDVVRLHDETRRRLEAAWYDEADLLDAAVESLRAGTASVDGLGTVAVYLPERTTRHGAALLRAIADRHPLVVVAATCGDPRADGDTIRSVGRLDGTPAAPPEGGQRPFDVVAENRTRVVTVSDADEEVRAGLRAIIDEVGRGTPLDRIALLFSGPEPYARLAYEQLTAAGIPVNGTATMPLTARLAARTLLGLLSLPKNRFRREAVFAWLAGARVRDRGRWVPTAAWERLSRDAAVVERKDWDPLLARLADELDFQADRDDQDPDAPEWRARRSRQSAQRARDLRLFVLTLIEDLETASAEARAWPVWAKWARRHLANLLGGEPERTGWPLVEQRAAEKVERAIDRLACLGEIEGPVTLEVFARTLELELEGDLGRVGRMGEGVFVGPISMGVGLDLELVVILGLAEGVFPARARDDSLLPDNEREATGDELPLRASLVEKRHRELLASLAGARRQLLCVPRGDLRGGRERVPSRWVLETAEALAGGTWTSEELLRPHPSEHWLEHVASFDAGLRSVTFPVSDQEYRLRARLAGTAAGASGVPPDPVFVAGSTALGGRRSSRFSRFDGNVAGLAVPSPAERVMSATRLENWAACPFAYLVGDVLGVKEIENPEEELTITPLNRGSLIHEILEEFVTEVLARPTQPRASDPWTDDDGERLRVIANRHCDAYEARGLSGRPVYWHRERQRIVADVIRFLEEDSAHRAKTRTRPVAAELAFGLTGSRVGTLSVELRDGREVRFRGRADRVDVAEDGTIHVVDYKSGSTRRYKGLSAADPVLGGKKLQLPVYGQAARALLNAPDRPVRAEYWFTSAKGGFERIGYTVTDEILRHFGETLELLVAAIEAGVFPPLPTATSTSPRVECPYCDPDGLGVMDLRRAWDRKVDDPALAAFAAVLPLGGGADDA
jgi:ATP-dependent helicase/nuclease subunit B